MMRTGFAGQGWAQAGQASSKAHTVANSVLSTGM